MIAIGIILIIITFLILCALASIDETLKAIIRHQNEVIKTLKNSNK